MKIFYTGATAPNIAQPDPSKSLGLYPSVTEIQNASLNNLFDALSKYTIQNGRDEVRAIILSNEDVVTYSSLRAFIEHPDDSASDDVLADSCTFKLAYVNLTTDSCGDIVFPYSVSNQYALPYNVTFVDANDFDEALVLPNLPPDTMIGLWIKRTITPAARQPLSNDDLVAILDGTLVLDTQENISLKFDWLP